MYKKENLISIKVLLFVEAFGLFCNLYFGISYFEPQLIPFLLPLIQD